MLVEKISKYATCILSLILLIIIVLSKNIISDEIQFYFLIIIVLLIIITCFLDEINLPSFISENFVSLPMNMKDNTRKCYERSKEHQKYNHKIEDRLNSWRKTEENDRNIKDYTDEDHKLIELAELNSDYLSNGESF